MADEEDGDGEGDEVDESMEESAPFFLMDESFNRT